MKTIPPRSSLLKSNRFSGARHPELAEDSGGKGKDTDGALYLAKSERALAAELVKCRLLSVPGWNHLEAFERGMIQRRIVRRQDRCSLRNGSADQDG